jgi:protein-S-isoprenylcysteine O-methyltransferase Ste14
LQFGLLGALLLEPNAPIIYSSENLSEYVTSIYIFAILILLLAFIDLRPSLRISPIPLDGAPLITKGIYRWVRHPMYLAVSMFGAGMALNNLNWITVVIWIALVVTLILKARFEDQLLLDIHPEAAKYQKKRSRGES